MDKSWWTRLFIVLFVALGCAWFLTPTYYSFFKLDRADRNNVKKLEAILPGWAPPAKRRLSLGLDLQGGIHMVMRVDTDLLARRARPGAGQRADRHHRAARVPHGR